MNPKARATPEQQREAAEQLAPYLNQSPDEILWSIARLRELLKIHENSIDAIKALNEEAKTQPWKVVEK